MQLSVSKLLISMHTISTKQVTHKAQNSPYLATESHHIPFGQEIQ